ncbi:MAG: hypothetical protein AAF804_21770 [Bacteroidota bacterium]
MKQLKNRYLDLLGGYQFSSDAARIRWELIESHYQEPHRHYHTLLHLQAMAKEVQAVEDQLNDPDCFWFALFYHDLIYDPMRQDNEAASAKVMQEQLAQSSFSQSERVKELILATQHHAPSKDFDQQAFLDVDLAILGQAPSVYQRYAQQIREEYHMFPDPLYHPGRKQVLQNLLNRPSIYQTDHFKSIYEAQARANLTQELANY